MEQGRGYNWVVKRGGSRGTTVRSHSLMWKRLCGCVRWGNEVLDEWVVRGNSAEQIIVFSIHCNIKMCISLHFRGSLLNFYYCALFQGNIALTRRHLFFQNGDRFRQKCVKFFFICTEVPRTRYNCKIFNLFHSSRVKCFWKCSVTWRRESALRVLLRSYSVQPFFLPPATLSSGITTRNWILVKQTRDRSPADWARAPWTGRKNTNTANPHFE